MLRTPKGWSLLLVGALTAVLSLSAEARRGNPSDCAAEADRASRSGGTVIGGATRGAARGALFGAIVGNKKGARRGAALGAAVGTTRRAVRKDDVYRRVYDDCMRYGY